MTGFTQWNFSWYNLGYIPILWITLRKQIMPTRDLQKACKQAHVWAQARIVRASTKLSGEASRQESEPALISANFSFPSRKPQKINAPTNFHQKYEHWQLRFLGKTANLFHNNMQAWYTLLVKKNHQSLSSKDTHLIPSDLAFRSAVAFVLFCCPLAITTGSNTFVIFNSSHICRRKHNKYILIISCSLFSLKLNQT